MILVCCSFGFGVRLVAQFGIGMAIAGLIDAFIVRTLLVPALMHMFGATNRWLSRRLDRVLPHMSVEPAGDETTRSSAHRASRRWCPDNGHTSPGHW